MTPRERHQRVKELFGAAAALPEGEREAYLLAAGADAEVCAEVKLLLRNVQEQWSAGPLGIDPGPLRRAAEEAAAPGTGEGAARAGAAGAEGARIGRYTVRGVIAEGGMGTVYEARQEEPARTVALKVIRAGMISGAALKRFEHESRVLAVLSHPGIAQVYEAGRDSAGLPYFAMEYIPGARNLVEYAEEEGLSAPARLELLARVCDAVHHGHQKGVIHRDLKPANILVDTRSGAAQPKVIDFGVARATDSDVTVATMDTRVGEIIGTLRYMSPEQCEGDPRAVDTRSDVFALGTIAYELLTGRLPYDLTGASLAGVARIIRETPPAAPSSVKAGLRGDAETLVLKALEKEPARRYQSAAEMGADIRRLLAHQPLMARPPSTIYLARKFVRRHRVGTGAAAACAAALVVGAAGFAWQAHRVAAERDRAVKERAKAEAIAGFIRTALQSSDPNRGGKQEMLVADAMSKAVEQLDSGQFKDQPEIEGSLRLTIAEILRGNGRNEEALSQAERGLGILQRLHPGDDPSVARGMSMTGGCLQALGRSEAALAKIQDALEMNQRLVQGDDVVVATGLNDLGLCLQSLGRNEDALPWLQGALEMNQRLHPGDHEDVSVNLNNIGLCLHALGRPAEALVQLEAALAMRRRLFKGDHPLVATGLGNVGTVLSLLGRPGDALPRLQEAAEMSQRLFKGDHPTTANNLRHLSLCLAKLDRLPEALGVAQQAAAMAARTLPEGHPIRQKCESALANLTKKAAEQGVPTDAPGEHR